MAIPVAVVVSFVWTYVIPIIRDGVKVINKGTYDYIKDRVDDVDVLNLKGFEKRVTVYGNAIAFLEAKGVDTSMYSSVFVYLLIEIAVANLKKKQNKLIKK
jgi:hypothetical protein